MASANPNQPKQTTPPAAGSRPSIRVDEALAADLADLMSTGPNFADAVRQAVGQIAAMYRTAWAHGIVPEGTAPTLAAYQFAEQVPAEAAASGYDVASDTSDARPTRPVGRRMPEAPTGSHVRTRYADELLARRTQQQPRPPASPTARTARG
ncbi:hypothetical protein [Streptomyces sp. NPDC057301]|uniref:hypothetical protein n=1 Tax=Streptomyces sp. NPDC057301 TaxID=3346093 RepID=UPI0036348024